MTKKPKTQTLNAVPLLMLLVLPSVYHEEPWIFFEILCCILLLFHLKPAMTHLILKGNMSFHSGLRPHGTILILLLWSPHPPPSSQAPHGPALSGALAVESPQGFAFCLECSVPPSIFQLRQTLLLLLKKHILNDVVHTPSLCCQSQSSRLLCFPKILLSSHRVNSSHMSCKFLNF